MMFGKIMFVGSEKTNVSCFKFKRAPFEVVTEGKYTVGSQR